MYSLFSHFRMLLVFLRRHLYVSKISLLFMSLNHYCLANFFLLIASFNILLNQGLDVNFILPRTSTDALIIIPLSYSNALFTVSLSSLFSFRMLCIWHLYFSLILLLLNFLYKYIYIAIKIECQMYVGQLKQKGNFQSKSFRTIHIKFLSSHIVPTKCITALFI